MFKLELVEDLLPELKRRIRSLEGREVDIGMFAEQGKHEDSGFKYVDLFRHLSEGNPAKNLPPRSPLLVASVLNPPNTSPLRRNLKKLLTNLSGKSPMTPDKVLENTGEFYRKKVRDVFGDESKLAPKAKRTKERSESPNTPLINTGDLASKVAFKVDNQNPKEIGK